MESGKSTALQVNAFFKQFREVILQLRRKWLAKPRRAGIFVTRTK
jgi:hypothetical protein